MRNMYVLVDWDNLDNLQTRQGPRYIADRIWETLKRISPTETRLVTELRLRFYGGWHDGAGLTRAGQQLLAGVAAEFPFVQREGQARHVIVLAEVAQSLVRLPRHVLHRTYRKRGAPPRLTCDSPAIAGCTANSCPMHVVHKYISTRTCPNLGCTIDLDHFIARAEQKLVDSMMVSDLISMAEPESAVVLVSSDDDLWPGMLVAMDMGAHIIHLCTKYPSTHAVYLGTLKYSYSHGVL